MAVLHAGETTVTDSGRLTGNGGTATGADTGSYGMVTYGNVGVSGAGSLTGNGGMAVDGGSIGVMVARADAGAFPVDSRITLTGGTLTGTGNMARLRSIGVWTDGGTGHPPARYRYTSVDVSGGTLTATGGTAVYDSIGVRSGNGGKIKLSGGVFTGTAGASTTTVNGDSIGVWTESGLTVSGGVFTATGDTVTPGGRLCLSYGVSTDREGDGFVISGGMSEVKGRTRALGQLPTLAGVRAEASTQYDGQGLVPYDSAANGTYLYFRTTPAPATPSAPTGSTGDGDPMAYTAEQLAALRAGQTGAAGADAQEAALPIAAVPAIGDAPWWVRTLAFLSF